MKILGIPSLLRIGLGAVSVAGHHGTDVCFHAAGFSGIKSMSRSLLRNFFEIGLRRFRFRDF